MKQVRRLLLPFALMLLLLGAPHPGMAQVAVSVTVAPPPLPVYAQPAIPGPGWIWTPGYWAWGPYGYYWVPGTWVQPPRVGLLWTPGYWGWVNGVYVWHAGYWGPRVGFYGGIDYGFGYIGVGYFGGFWARGVFHYNAAVNNIRNVRIANVYRQTTVNTLNITRNVTGTRVSFNGGQGGIAARPTPQELAAARDPHVAATSLQARHEMLAQANPALRASVNHGRPAVAATPRPTAFGARGAGHPQLAGRRIGEAAPPHRPGPQARRPAHQPPNGGSRSHPGPEDHRAP